MTVCDLTHAYHETSGGIRTYVDAKRRYLLAHTGHRHGLVIPSATGIREAGKRWETVRLRCPTIPGAAPYRWFPRSKPPAGALVSLSPSSIELGTYYMPTEARAAFAAREIVRQRGGRCIVSAHIHTDFPRSYAESYSKRIFGTQVGNRIRYLADRYAKWVLNQCDFVITQSPQFRDQIQDMGVDQVIMVPQGVDLERFGPHRADPEIRAEFGVSGSCPLLLYSGRFDSEKHVDLLVEAFDQLPIELNAVLVMIGEGPKRNELTAAAASRPGLHVLPYQTDKARVAALLATADVYVTAGPHEVYAFSVVEAQASGTAVVGVESGGLVSRVPEGLGFLSPVGDAGAFAGLIERAFHSHRAMGAAARRHAEEHYSWSSTFEPVLKETARVLGLQ